MTRTNLILLSAILAMGAPAQARAREVIEGVWRNRPNTVVVRIAPCAAELCGIIVDASSDAKASTRKAGTSNLIGTRVLTDLRKDSVDTYRGQVFNPNLNIHASATVTMVGPNVLIVKGCVLAALVCRQQHWYRIG